LWQVAGLVLVTPPLIYLLVKLTYNGLLTLAIRFTDAAPLGRLFSSRWIGFAILAGAALLVLPSLVAAISTTHPAPAPAPAPLPPARAPARGALPRGPGEGGVLVGTDGALPGEIDYLIALGELPERGRMAHEGEVFSYRRKHEPPASFWTAIATGIPGPDHGV